MTNDLHATLQARVDRLIRRFQSALNLQGWDITSRVVQQSTFRRDHHGEFVTADVEYSRQRLTALIRVSSSYFDDYDYSRGAMTEHQFLSEVIAHEMLHVWLSEYRFNIKQYRTKVDREETFCDAMGMILTRALCRPKRRK